MHGLVNVNFHGYLQQSVAGLPSLNLPDVCTNSPEKEKAFCTAHCQLLKEKAPHVPLGLKDFLKHCGISQDTHMYQKMMFIIYSFLQKLRCWNN